MTSPACGHVTAPRPRAGRNSDIQNKPSPFAISGLPSECDGVRIASE